MKKAKTEPVDAKQNDQIFVLEEKVAELDNKWKRALADYQNLEKRTLQDRQTFVKLSNLSLLTKLLPVVDDLERAAKHINDPGLEMVIKQLKSVLKDEGVTEIQAMGADFDPTTMECVEQGEGEENKVIEVALPGYLLHDMIIRPAKVVVGSKKE